MVVFEYMYVVKKKWQLHKFVNRRNVSIEPSKLKVYVILDPKCQLKNPSLALLKAAVLFEKKLSKDIRQLICKKVQFKIYQNISLATAV